jgi:polyhydroxyalkanoate synthase subunit PhaC
MAFSREEMEYPEMSTSPLALRAMARAASRNVAMLRTLPRLMASRAAIAQTPKSTVWALGKAKLYRYDPRVARQPRHRLPVLLVFGLVTRPSVFDLTPGHSFVEYLLAQNYEVYLLDWGSPGPEDKNLKLDNYALEYLPRAIWKMRAVGAVKEFTMLGWCIGAILVTAYAALRPDDGLRNLILITAPLDFSAREKSTLVRWIHEPHFDVEKLLAAFGNVPGEMFREAGIMLKPVENSIGTLVQLWDHLEDQEFLEEWHALKTWAMDTVPVAGAAFRQLIVELYRENRLMNGDWTLFGKRVDLHNIRANLLNVAAGDDHIAPPCQSARILEKVGSKDKESVTLPGGHIDILSGKAAAASTWPLINTWLAARSNWHHSCP